MLELGEQIVRVVDEAAAPVTAGEARGRAVPRDRRRRVAVPAGVVAVILVGSAAIVWAARPGSRRTNLRVIASSTTTAPRAVAIGSAVGTLEIPSLGVRVTLYEGATAAIEERGPIHDPASAMPGQPGNVVIAGHRTTHGAPFFRLDDLNSAGLRHTALIIITTRTAKFAYVVDGSFTVPAGSGGLFPAAVLARVAGRTDSLTLITDAPRYSAVERLVVTAERRRDLEPLLRTHDYGPRSFPKQP